MVSEKVTRRQKSISRVLRERKKMYKEKLKIFRKKCLKINY